jgi:DNA polymerase sigma
MIAWLFNLSYPHQTVEPHSAVINLRSQTIRRVQRVIDRYGEQYTVELFGSTRYGVSSLTSDLDLVVVVRIRPFFFLDDLPYSSIAV